MMLVWTVHGEFSKVGVLFIRVPYYLRDLHRDPNVEKYPYMNTLGKEL